MAGKSFMVTVSAPNAPCTHTQTSVSVGHQGLTGTPPWLRPRCSQVVTASVRISTPTPVAR
jgi:hypothetical protein